VDEVVRELTWDEVRTRRTRRHHLLDPSGRSPAAVARDVCGIHAQVMSAAELSLALRLPVATRSDVRRALWEDRTLVKTYGPRGTVHLLAAEDLPRWTAALSAVPGPPHPLLDDAGTDAVVDAIATALGTGPLTADELDEAVVGLTGPWAGDRVVAAFSGWWPRWRAALHTAAHRGVVVLGPDRGRRTTYARPPDRPGVSTEDGLRFVVRRYLLAYGPASPEHLARWLGAPAPWAGQVLERTDGLEQVRLDGTGPLWQVADDAAPAAEDAGVRLLPYFDTYVVGSRPRDLVYPGRAADRALSGGQAGNYPVLLIDGVVAGVWHLRRSGRRLAVTVEPLQCLPAARLRALEEQVDRVGHILEGEATLQVGEITVGPHA
jgi:hypothetical protein